MPQRKRVTVSLAADLLETIDRAARTLRETRSALMEDWLRSGAKRARQGLLDEEIAAYYRGQTASERASDSAATEALFRLARGNDYDGPAVAQPPRRARR